MRKADLPDEVRVYRGHTKNQGLVTAVRFAPNGKRACSGDSKGFVHVWSTGMMKTILERRFLQGTIRDIAWCGESQRIAIAGEGKSSFTFCFRFDTGSSLGEMVYHTKNCLSVDFSSKRPWKLVTGSEDQTVGIYKGPPFKLGVKVMKHKGYV